MADFKKSFDRTMRWEGMVLENVADDKGGMTCAGISRVYNPQWPGWAKIDDMVKAGAVDLENVKADIMNFYSAEYFPLERLTSQKIADQIYQAYINMGRIAKKWAQSIAGVDIDGIIGEQSIAAINRCDETNFCKRFYEMQVQYYDAIIKRDATQEKFRKGWLARAAAFL